MRLFITITRSVWPPVCLSARLSVRPPACPSIRPSVRPYEADHDDGGWVTQNISLKALPPHAQISWGENDDKDDDDDDYDDDDDEYDEDDDDRTASCIDVLFYTILCPNLSPRKQNPGPSFMKVVH